MRERLRRAPLVFESCCDVVVRVEALRELL